MAAVPAVAAAAAAAKCVPPDGIFGFAVHGPPLLVAAGALTWKWRRHVGGVRLGVAPLPGRRREPAQGRSRSELALDASRQLLAALWLRLLGALAAGWAREGAGGAAAEDPCAGAFAQEVLQATLGTLLSYLLLNGAAMALEQSLQSGFVIGDYSDEQALVSPRAYALQLSVWLGCSTASWLLVSLLSVLGQPAVAEVSRTFLLVLSWDASLELAFVVFCAPCCLDVLQFWLTDSFIQRGGLPLKDFWTLVMYHGATAVRGSRRRLGPKGERLLKDDVLDDRDDLSAYSESRCERGDIWAAAPRVAGFNQVTAAEFQQLEEERRAVEETREEVRQEIQDLQEALYSHWRQAGEDATEREELRSQVEALERQLEKREGDLRTAAAAEAELRARLGELTNAAAASARAAEAATNVASAAAGRSGGVPVTAGSSPSTAASNTEADDGRRVSSSGAAAPSTKIVARSHGSAAAGASAAEEGQRRTQALLAKPRGSAELDQKLGNLEAKLRSLGGSAAPSSPGAPSSPAVPTSASPPRDLLSDVAAWRASERSVLLPLENRRGGAPVAALGGAASAAFGGSGAYGSGAYAAGGGRGVGAYGGAAAAVGRGGSWEALGHHGIAPEPPLPLAPLPLIHVEVPSGPFSELQSLGSKLEAQNRSLRNKLGALSRLEEESSRFRAHLEDYSSPPQTPEAEVLPSALGGV